MVHVYRVLVGLFVYAVMLYACRSPRPSTLTITPPAAAQPSTHAELFPSHGNTPIEREQFQRDLDARTERLQALQAEETVREAALEQRPGRVHRVRLTMRLPWAQLISTNYARFEALRKAAATQPNGQIDCNICDGQSYMPCLLCHGSADCGDCLGMGEPVQGQLCPMCVGSGKCAMCKGYGRMLCPFCDDGTIYSDHTEPREECWVE